MTAVDAGLLVVRVVVGLTFAAHGVNKFLGGGRIPGTGRWFDSIGMRPGLLHALAAASTEIGAGVLLALGLFTPFAGAAVVAVMLVAAWTVHRAAGFFSAGGGWEYNLVLAVAALVPAIAGPGAVSLDHVLGIAVAGWAGAAIGVGLGLAAGAAQLAVFFRPASSTA